MTSNQPGTVLFISSTEKGQDTIRQAKEMGWRTMLVTATSVAEGNWPWDSIDDFFHMPNLYNVDDVVKGVSYLSHDHPFDRIFPLDDFEVEMAATLREHTRIPGMGESQARLFRDKLAMRVRARESGIPIPAFVPIFGYDALRAFMDRLPPPWVLKPRLEAASIGITRINSPDELWSKLEMLGDKQTFHLLEQFLPGDVFHADSIVSGGQVIFSEVQKYGKPPMAVFHGGGIPTSRTLPRDSEDARAIRDLNARVIGAFGLQRGVTHMEFIKSADGRLHFLETAARVGGANTSDLVEAATGINLWQEWARIELGPEPYQLPEHRAGYAGIIITLARQEHPDTSAYADPEIVWRMDKKHHAGLIVRSDDPDRIEHLLTDYSARFTNDFHASLPAWQERPPL